MQKILVVGSVVHELEREIEKRTAPLLADGFHITVASTTVRHSDRLGDFLFTTILLEKTD